MKSVTLPFLITLFSVYSIAENVQNYHKEVSVLYNWMKQMVRQQALPYMQLQQIEQEYKQNHDCMTNRILALSGNR